MPEHYARPHQPRRSHGRRVRRVWLTGALTIRYDALAGLSGAQRPVHVQDPLVLADSLVTRDGGVVDVLISQHDDPVEATLCYPHSGTGSGTARTGRAATRCGSRRSEPS